MANINTTIEKPKYDNFRIYRDGELDKSFELKKLSKFGLRALGYIGYVALDKLDEMVMAAQK